MSILINIIVTCLRMWVGSSFGKTGAKESGGVDEFFLRRSVPSESKAEVIDDGRKSPFYAVGISLIFLGTVLIIIALVLNSFGDSKALLIDSIAGGILLFSGLAMYIKTTVFASNKKTSKRK